MKDHGALMARHARSDRYRWELPSGLVARTLWLDPTAQRRYRPRYVVSAPRRCGCGGAGTLQTKLRPLVSEVATAFPEAQVELWAVDEHRIGRKPILRRSWAPKGRRPWLRSNTAMRGAT
jgi:hypothetical protein